MSAEVIADTWAACDNGGKVDGEQDYDDETPMETGDTVEIWDAGEGPFRAVVTSIGGDRIRATITAWAKTPAAP